MGADLPDYYFRVRENGALVFRVDTENRQRRIEMDQIAVVNIRSGEIKPHGDRVLSDEDVAVIRDWMVDRKSLLAERDVDELRRAVKTWLRLVESAGSGEVAQKVLEAMKKDAAT